MTIESFLSTRCTKTSSETCVIVSSQETTEAEDKSYGFFQKFYNQARNIFSSHAIPKRFFGGDPLEAPNLPQLANKETVQDIWCYRMDATEYLNPPTEDNCKYINDAKITNECTCPKISDKKCEPCRQCAFLDPYIPKGTYIPKSPEAEEKSLVPEVKCRCLDSSHPNNVPKQLELLKTELQINNCRLKKEVEQTKAELKCYLEMYHGPIKTKLNLDGCKCIKYHQQLQEICTTMKITKASHERELANLRKQLAVTSENLKNLEKLNKKLQKDVENQECICKNMEDELRQRKITEAKALMELEADECEVPCNAMKQRKRKSKTKSNSLKKVARKLSDALNHVDPCCESPEIPMELLGAARGIKNLTDMVSNRTKKNEKFFEELNCKNKCAWKQAEKPLELDEETEETEIGNERLCCVECKASCAQICH